MNDGDPSPATPARGLAEITVDLQMTLDELTRAARTCGAPADLWIIVNACQRTLTQLSAAVDPLGPWLLDHDDRIATHGQGASRLSKQLEQIFAQLNDAAQECSMLADGLSRLG